ncbi:MAG: 2-phosphosulfolactate phosphatase [Bacteroidota bacterium]
MDLDVILTPCATTADDLAGRTVVVIDVLRASSTIVTALQHGARAVIPAATLGDAGRLAATLDPDTSIVGGERGGKPVDGMAMGNSPIDYSEDRVGRRTLVLTTTNGTPAIALAKKARSAAIGCFLNASASVDFLRQALDAHQSVTLLCAGYEGRVALEDTLCAGLMLKRLLNPSEASGLNDSGLIAYALYQGSQEHLARALVGAAHTKRLMALGFQDDVTYCAQMDTTDTLPMYRDGRIVLT